MLPYFRVDLNPNDFVKLTRISIKVMKDLWYFGHLHLKRQMKNGKENLVLHYNGLQEKCKVN